MNTTKYIILFLSIVLFSRCFVQPNYSTTPKIDFRQIVIADTSDVLGNSVLQLRVYFKVLDGDGNFGFDKDYLIHDGDTIRNNFYCSLFLLENNVVSEYVSEDSLFSGSIPWTDPVGLNNYYKSTVIYNLSLPPFLPDTIKLSFYVTDNELNKSNIQSTMWIPTNYRGVLADSVNLIED